MQVGNCGLESGLLAASLLLYILEVAVLHSVHPGVGLHHERLQDLLVPDGLGRQDDLDDSRVSKKHDVQVLNK